MIASSKIVDDSAEQVMSIDLPDGQLVVSRISDQEPWAQTSTVSIEVKEKEIPPHQVPKN